MTSPRNRNLVSYFAQKTTLSEGPTPPPTSNAELQESTAETMERVINASGNIIELINTISKLNTQFDTEPTDQDVLRSINLLLEIRDLIDGEVSYQAAVLSVAESGTLSNREIASVARLAPATLSKIVKGYQEQVNDVWSSAVKRRWGFTPESVDAVAECEHQKFLSDKNELINQMSVERMKYVNSLPEDQQKEFWEKEVSIERVQGRLKRV